MPACILNQSVHSNAICTVVTDPTEAILQAMVLLLYFMPRPCYNYITASDPSIKIETKLLKPIPISINSHADTFIPIQKIIAQIFM